MFTSLQARNFWAVQVWEKSAAAAVLKEAEDCCLVEHFVDLLVWAVVF